MKEPLISIIIPSYNYARYLNECFSNLQKLNYSNWECLLIDNNSTDNTKQIVQDFINKEPRIRYYFNQGNGPSPARNMGIKEAKGEFIQFLDADDLLESDKFTNAIAIFNSQPDTDIVYSGCRYFQDGKPEDLYFSMSVNKSNDRDWMPKCEGKQEQMLPYLLKENIMVISSPLVRSATLKGIGEFDNSLAFNEDWELWLRFAFADKKFVYDASPKSYALIRVHKTSHSRNPFKMFLAGYIVGERYKSKIKDRVLRAAFEKKSTFAIYRMELLLLENISDLDFFMNSLSLLEAQRQDDKYKYWRVLFESKQFSTLKRRMKLHLFISKLKMKL